MLFDFIAAHLTLVTELVGLFIVLLILVFAAGVAIAKLDGIAVEDGVYFAFITALTVGFGDFVPRSRGSKILAVLLALIGIIIAGVIVSVTVHALDIAIESAQGGAAGGGSP